MNRHEPRCSGPVHLQTCMGFVRWWIRSPGSANRAEKQELWRPFLQESWETMEKLLYKMDCKAIHPGKLTWNLKIIQLKRKIIFQTSIFGFHVNSPGSRRTFGSLSPAPWSSEEGWLFFADNDATWRRSKRASTKACNMSKPFEMHAAHDIRPGIHIDRLRWISLNQDVVSVLCRALCVFNWMRGSIIVLLFWITWDSTLSFSHWWGQKWVSVIVMHPEKGRWEPENDDLFFKQPMISFKKFCVKNDLLSSSLLRNMGHIHILVRVFLMFWSILLGSERSFTLPKKKPEKPWEIRGTWDFPRPAVGSHPNCWIYMVWFGSTPWGFLEIFGHGNGQIFFGLVNVGENFIPAVSDSSLLRLHNQHTVTRSIAHGISSKHIATLRKPNNSPGKIGRLTQKETTESSSKHPFSGASR